jgi:hypothetical protein
MSHTAFSARQVYDTAPLGALICFYDGTPEPPGRCCRKRAAWSNTNGTGRLVRKTPASDLSLPSFKLHVGDFGGDLAAAQAYRTFIMSSDLRFAVLGKPRPGQAAVLRDQARHSRSPSGPPHGGRCPRSALGLQRRACGPGKLTVVPHRCPSTVIAGLIAPAPSLATTADGVVPARRPLRQRRVSCRGSRVSAVIVGTGWNANSPLLAKPQSADA